MRSRGHEFTILTSFGGRNLPAHDEYQGIPIFRFPFMRAISEQDLQLMKKCIQGVKEIKNIFKPDLVHLHMSAPISYFHIKTLKVKPSPTLLTLHTCFGDFDGGPDTVLGQTLRVADWTTMVSEAVMADAVKIFPEISERSSVVYNGMEFHNVSRMPLEFTIPRILGMGRFIRRKGFDVLLNAFSLLLAEYPQAHLTLVGDGTKRESLKQQVLDLDMQDSVEFTGQVQYQQVPELINKANVVVIPSRFSDPFPTVALEAGLMGRPVVATKMGGLMEMVVNGETGLLVEPNDPQSLFEAILSLFNHPREAVKMGQAGRSRVQNHYSWERYLNSYDNLYRRMVSNY